MGLLQMIRFASFLGAALLAVATAASATTIGFSQIGSESDWRTAFSADMKAEAKIRGIDLHFDDAQGSVDGQFAAVRRFIAERVDAIVIAPVVVAGWTPVLQEARAAHIPVFIADRSVDTDPSLFVARVGNDTNLEGRLAASWLAQATRGHCSIVELQGTIGAAPTIGRKTGFAAVIAQFPGMRIIRSESGDFTAEGGKRVMADFIKSTGGLKGVCAVWAHNDNMLLGAIETMKSAGLHPGKEVLTISVDGVPGIYHAMLAGDANASVEVKSDIGKYIFDVVQGYLQGKRDYPKWVLIPTDLHTPEDAAKMLEQQPGF
jgi:galactofuranose transport system substrate-binding protein